MRKVIKSKLSSTKKLVRGVLSKPSVGSHEPSSTRLEALMAEELLKNEIEALTDQVSNLKAAINSLQGDSEQKEIAIANLAREKEKMGLELLKTRRSNINLTQQLDDERKFYLKEKQIYCQEMNACKRLNRRASSSANSSDQKNVEKYQEEILKLKRTLNQTLEANYNLSIKFLRMKNTKTCLKTELQAMKLEHEKLVNDYKTKIENLTADLNDLVNEKLVSPISPSSKKYLQLVKQNSCLIYENLCLQLEVDNLNYKFQKFKLEKTKSETNQRLKYIHHNTETAEKMRKHSHNSRSPKMMEYETSERLQLKAVPSCSGCSKHKEEKVVKIFERKETPGIPEIRIIDERKLEKDKRTRKKNARTRSKSIVDHSSPSQSRTNLHRAERDLPDLKINLDDNCREKIRNKNSKELALFQLSAVQTAASRDNITETTSIIKSLSCPNLLHTNFGKTT